MLNERRRPDGRAFDEIRKITIETGVLPRTHGSALFTRGETQALVTVTLGTKDDEQRIELLEPGESPPSASCCTTIFRRSAWVKWVYARCRAPRDRPRRTGRAVDSARASRRSEVSLHDARGQRHSGVQRVELDGDRLRRDAWR